MRVAFVAAEVFFSEPLGVMGLSAVCKGLGHSTKLISLKRQDLAAELSAFDPDLVAYSAMTADMAFFREGDAAVRAWSKRRGRPLPRVMGGPHPTHFPEVLAELELDAICVGEGDRAIAGILASLEAGRGLAGIPNVVPPGGTVEGMARELVSDLDSLPFMDRDVFYEAAPHLRQFRLRSVLTSRGCPYRCTYCHNHAFNKLFEGCGPVLRRHSVDYVIAELRLALEKWPPVAMIRFGDDTLAHRVDDWLVGFLRRYKAEIGLPFYCLMRSNTLTEEMAKLLAGHCCHSVSMSLESGSERVRNEVLRRGLSDQVVLDSFRFARQYGLQVQGNSLMGLPGGTFADDWRTYEFARRLAMGMPTFAPFIPYPRTDLTEHARALGLIPEDLGGEASFLVDRSPMGGYSEKEKDMQINIACLGVLFCNLPEPFQALFRFLVRLPPNPLFRLLGRSVMIYKYYAVLFPKALPPNPFAWLRFYLASIRYLVPKRVLLKPGG